MSDKRFGFRAMDGSAHCLPNYATFLALLRTTVHLRCDFIITHTIITVTNIPIFVLLTWF